MYFIVTAFDIYHKSYILKIIQPIFQGFIKLTHWGRDKMATIFQTPFSNGFSRMKMYEFLSNFHLSFESRGPINNIRALFQIMAWRRPGNKPLSETMMVSLLRNICITLPQWVNLVGVMTIITWKHNTMAVDAVAPCIARPSTAIVLTLGQTGLTFHEEAFQ